MAQNTGIQYCDSTVNVTPVCSGCELWHKGKGGPCFAGNLVKAHSGWKGWPRHFEKFDDSSFFPSRLLEATKWDDLTNTDRPEKPWLNGYPRVIFLNDLGDFASEIIPMTVRLSILAEIAKQPHIYMIFSKRAMSMAETFNEFGFIPENVIPVVSITSNETKQRAQMFIDKLKIYTSVPFGLSFEPLRKRIIDPQEVISNYDWVTIGGMSEQGEWPAEPFEVEWAEEIIWAARATNVKVFMKQLGTNPTYHGERLSTTDKHNDNLANFPESIRIREMWTSYWKPPVQLKMFEL